MTRAQHIAVLQMQYALAMSKRQLKKAGLLYARLAALMTRELQVEIEFERRAS